MIDVVQGIVDHIGLVCGGSGVDVLGGSLAGEDENGGEEHAG